MTPDFTKPWTWVQITYVPIGMLVWLWVMGVIGAWLSPAMRLSIWLGNPKKVQLPVRLGPEAVPLLLGGFGLFLWVLMNFLFWPIAALYTLVWIALTAKAKGSTR